MAQGRVQENKKSTFFKLQILWIVSKYNFLKKK